MIWNSTRKLADAIFNDIVSGLRGYHLTISLSKELLEEEIIQMRLLIIKEYMMLGVLPIQDLLVSINCIPVDCEDLSKCRCNSSNCGGDPVAHFLIPLLLFDYGLKKSIYYLGSVDKQHPFIIYTKPFDVLSTILKYRKRGKNKPWVYIDVTPNLNGLLDCYIFNAPLIKQVSIMAIFKDLRLLEGFLCNCEGEVLNDIETLMDTNFNFLDTVIKERLTKLKLYYYRLMAAPLLPNDLRPAS